MLKIENSDKYSINFLFDRSSIKELKNSFTICLSSLESTLDRPILFDEKIFKKKQRQIKVFKEVTLLIKLGNNKLSKQDSTTVILELDEDDLEYGIKLLEGYQNNGNFDIAEFAYIDIKNFNYLSRIYFLEG